MSPPGKNIMKPCRQVFLDQDTNKHTWSAQQLLSVVSWIWTQEALELISPIIQRSLRCAAGKDAPPPVHPHRRRPRLHRGQHFKQRQGDAEEAGTYESIVWRRLEVVCVFLLKLHYILRLTISKRPILVRKIRVSQARSWGDGIGKTGDSRHPRIDMKLNQTNTNKFIKVSNLIGSRLSSPTSASSAPTATSTGRTSGAWCGRATRGGTWSGWRSASSTCTTRTATAASGEQFKGISFVLRLQRFSESESQIATLKAIFLKESDRIGAFWIFTMLKCTGIGLWRFSESESQVSTFWKSQIESKLLIFGISTTLLDV